VCGDTIANKKGDREPDQKKKEINSSGDRSDYYFKGRRYSQNKKILPRGCKNTYLPAEIFRNSGKSIRRPKEASSQDQAEKSNSCAVVPEILAKEERVEVRDCRGWWQRGRAWKGSSGIEKRMISQVRRRLSKSDLVRDHQRSTVEKKR